MDHSSFKYVLTTATTVVGYLHAEYADVFCVFTSYVLESRQSFSNARTPKTTTDHSRMPSLHFSYMSAPLFASGRCLTQSVSSLKFLQTTSLTSHIRYLYLHIFTTSTSRNPWKCGERHHTWTPCFKIYFHNFLITMVNPEPSLVLPPGIKLSGNILYLLLRLSWHNIVIFKLNYHRSSAH